MAVDTPQQIVEAIYPAPLPGNYLDHLALAEQKVSATRFGALRSQAVAYRAMHAMAVRALIESGSPGASGLITSESEGGLSRSYAHGSGTSSVEDADLMRTEYGREYIRIRGTISTFMLRKGIGGSGTV